MKEKQEQDRARGKHKLWTKHRNETTTAIMSTRTITNMKKTVDEWKATTATTTTKVDKQKPETLKE